MPSPAIASHCEQESKVLCKSTDVLCSVHACRDCKSQLCCSSATPKKQANLCFNSASLSQILLDFSAMLWHAVQWANGPVYLHLLQVFSYFPLACRQLHILCLSLLHLLLKPATIHLIEGHARHAMQAYKAQPGMYSSNQLCTDHFGLQLACQLHDCTYLVLLNNKLNRAIAGCNKLVLSIALPKWTWVGMTEPLWLQVQRKAILSTLAHDTTAWLCICDDIMRPTNNTDLWQEASWVGRCCTCCLPTSRPSAAAVAAALGLQPPCSGPRRLPAGSLRQSAAPTNTKTEHEFKCSCIQFFYLFCPTSACYSDTKECTRCLQLKSLPVFEQSDPVGSCPETPYMHL